MSDLARVCKSQSKQNRAPKILIEGIASFERLQTTFYMLLAFDLPEFLNTRCHWSHPPDSNRRPADYESAALPTELGWLSVARSLTGNSRLAKVWLARKTLFSFIGRRFFEILPGAGSEYRRLQSVCLIPAAGASSV